MRRTLLLALAACSPQGTFQPSAATQGAPPPAWCGPAVAARAAGQTFATLQDALAAPLDQDRVEVCPGVHRGGFEIRGTAPSGMLEIIGVTGDPADVILDGDHQYAVLDAYAPGSLRLSGLTIRQGVDDPLHSVAGASLSTGLRGTVVVEDCVFEDNVSLANTGGVSVRDAGTIRFLRTAVRRNSGFAEGGVSLRVYGGPGVWFEDVVLEENGLSGPGFAGLRISANAVGAAAGMPRVQYHFDRVQVLNNTSGTGDGPAFMLNPVDDGYDLHIRDSDFRGNDGGPDGTIYVTTLRPDDLLRVRLQDVWFEENAGVVASALKLNNSWSWRQPTRPSILWMTGGGVVRSAVDPTWALGYPGAIQYHGNWRLVFQDVDFGTGADANIGNDLSNCHTDYGPGTTGYLHTVSRIGSPCLTWPPTP